MKTRSGRLQKIFLLKENEEKAECRTMGRVLQRLDAEMARLEELKSYRASYAAKSREPRQCNSAQWKDYQRFLHRLDQAIAVQTRIVLDCRRDGDLHRRRWMAKRQKSDSLERVVGRYRDQETAERERSLQATIDDLVSKPHRYS